MKNSLAIDQNFTDSRYTPRAGKKSAVQADSQLRIRVTWLYYVKGMTQSDIASQLNINRVMVNRLLAEARKRREVVIQITSPLVHLVELQHQLEEQFGLQKAIIAPLDNPDDDPTPFIASAAGTYVSGIMGHDMTIGVGWGRTLHTMLSSIEGRALNQVRVVSLLGGIAQARRFNPAEFAWQFAELFEAEGYLVSAPAVVDSPQTKQALLQHCGLEQILQLAESCTMALLSCGGITHLSTSYRAGHISEAERQLLLKAGAVGDVLYNFLDKNGQLIDHPINSRVISMSLERLKQIPEKVLVSGGLEKVAIIHAAIQSVQPTVLVTDEVTAQELLNQTGQGGLQ